MSRTLGRVYDVYNVSKELSEANFLKYKDGKEKTTWDEIEVAPEKIDYYFTDKIIDYLTSKKIIVMKTPFLKYTLTQVPDFEDEERFIKFPSLKPKNDFKRELMFYVGMLLSSYKKDKDEDIYGISNEFDDTLPLLLEYLYLKEENKEDTFDIKHLNQLKKYQKDYIKYYKDYQEFEDFKRETSFSLLSETKYDNFLKLCQDKEDEMFQFTKDSIIQLSSYEGLLGIIENVTSEKDIRELIEKLTLNKNENRASILKEYDIESFGYKRLRKKIENNRIK